MDCWWTVGHFEENTKKKLLNIITVFFSHLNKEL